MPRLRQGLPSPVLQPPIRGVAGGSRVNRLIVSRRAPQTSSSHTTFDAFACSARHYGQALDESALPHTRHRTSHRHQRRRHHRIVPRRSPTPDGPPLPARLCAFRCGSFFGAPRGDEDGRMMEEEARRRIAAARVGRLASVDANGRPHVVPICFAMSGDQVVSVVDGKPKRTLQLRRLENVRLTPDVQLMVDYYDDDWSLLWWVRISGHGRVIEHGSARGGGRPAGREVRPISRASPDGARAAHRDHPDQQLAGNNQLNAAASH